MTSQTFGKIVLSIDDYKRIFNILYKEHNEYCKGWIINNEEKFNLKNKCVCDIYNNFTGIKKTFKKYMDSFLNGLNCLDSNIMDNIYDIYGLKLNIRGRTKDYMSIIYKLNRIIKHNGGKYPIQKCLNDLLGYRIIDENYSNNIYSIIQYLEWAKNNNYRIRHIKRDKDGYKGYHIYFLGPNNYSFPIELQIWDSKDEQNNLKSHKIYKQDYIKWVKIYKSF